MGYVFYSNEPVRRKDEKIYTFKDYRIAYSKAYPEMAIIHGKNVEMIARAARSLSLVFLLLLAMEAVYGRCLR